MSEPSKDKPWYEEPGCIIALLILGGLIWIAYATSNPGGPDPYRDNPLSDPDLYEEGPWPK